ncbi:hypothetical protein BRC67_08525 [Halobacteriales archaeon QH_3_68_24]|nr:MAG: hypothetical protein BRC67_08525 [Halobacteriales archaeon QH_3_68_24]
MASGTSTTTSGFVVVGRAGDQQAVVVVFHVEDVGHDGVGPGRRDGRLPGEDFGRGGVREVDGGEPVAGRDERRPPVGSEHRLGRPGDRHLPAGVPPGGGGRGRFGRCRGRRRRGSGARRPRPGPGAGRVAGFGTVARDGNGGRRRAREGGHPEELAAVHDHRSGRDGIESVRRRGDRRPPVVGDVTPGGHSSSRASRQAPAPSAASAASGPNPGPAASVVSVFPAVPGDDPPGVEEGVGLSDASVGVAVDGTVGVEIVGPDGVTVAPLSVGSGKT